MYQDSHLHTLISIQIPSIRGRYVLLPFKVQRVHTKPDEQRDENEIYHTACDTLHKKKHNTMEKKTKIPITLIFLFRCKTW